MGTVQDEMTIGRFARLCRLSVKQLRHYDEAGLLRPARVDPATGYRYYVPAQARDALTVALLREIDLPLAVITAVLATPEPDRGRLLTAERDRLAERIDRDRARLALLDRLASGHPDHEVVRTTEPARRFAVVRATADPGRIGAAYGECVGRLLATLAGQPWTPPLWGLYPLDLPDGAADGMAVAAAAETDAITTLETVDLPAADVVSTVHHGPYAELPLAYHTLFAWIHERGLTPVGPARETYLVGPGEAEPADLLTRVILEVRP
ncbi:DNA-binding transcriptional MerR regulator [Hamadaea flava]|uniref:MerR family transcriptional regulator n=1 Tax=Hamadaea flava TaxID=1742688 RepID=A0ABV8LY79_9ACTN|nr:GyrI-like domain-containing protein [Hamadaea flava]MCP2328993.1 DNA-binding transcriptional MerR regulator [Hamadaea flava]